MSDGNLLARLPIPDAERDDAAIRRVLGVVFVLLAIAAGVVAAHGDRPDPLPAWALKHVAVWRLEVFAAVLLVPYVVLSLLVLLLHGYVMAAFNTPIGGGDAKKVTDEDADQTDASTELKKALDASTKIAASGLRELGRSVARIEEHLGLPELPPEDDVTLDDIVQDP